MENLNIALVHEWITNVAGAEKVLLALKEIFPQASIYTAVFDPERAEPFKNMDIKTSFLQTIPFMTKKRELLVPFTPIAFEQFDLSSYDIVISSSTIGAKGVITKPGTIHLSYCHTPPRYLWESNVDPRAKKGKLKWLRDNTTHKMRIWDRVAADRVDYYIANSRYVANRIKKYYKRDANVIYPPVDVDQFNLPINNKREYFLFTSRLVNYKRCDIVIDAFNELGLPLIVAGTGPDSKKLQKRAKQNISFLGRIPGDELVKTYQNAKALIFPAEEDFGIVPVEAMACGTPVIAFNRGGTTESVIDGLTGIFFDSQTKDSIIEAVHRFDACDFDQNSIRKQAEKFSKERFKTEIIEAIEKVIEPKLR